MVNKVKQTHTHDLTCDGEQGYAGAIGLWRKSSTASGANTGQPGQELKGKTR